MTLGLDSPELHKLSRAQLQSLAKRELVRAIGKNEDIICRLKQKHPEGVPMPETCDNPSASSAPPRQDLLMKAHKDASCSPAPETSNDRTDLKGKGKAVAEIASVSPSSSSEALEQLLYPEEEPGLGPSGECPEIVSVSRPETPLDQTLSQPAPFPRDPRCAALPEASDHDRRVDNEDEDEPADAYSFIQGPNRHMVIDALRQFTTLTNDFLIMGMVAAESQCLLQRSETVLEKTIPDARELTVTREYLETFLLARMKERRELWDGTGRMDKNVRKLRMEWLREQRRVESEKRWKEVNEFNKKHGLEPEAFSAFALEDDEDDIESLQTTPTSSRSGGLKRGRKDSGAKESDVDPGIDTSRRKRARS